MVSRIVRRSIASFHNTTPGRTEITAVAGVGSTRYSGLNDMKSTKFTRAQRVASFFSRVEIKGPNDCWVWRGCTYNCGYGSFKWRGKMRGANRVAWEIAHGQDAPDDMDVLHSCDNRLCVNPMHLALGTHRENMLDMHRKDRCTISVLKSDQVREIRKMLKERSRKEIAEHFGVKIHVIHGVASGRTYNHVS